MKWNSKAIPNIFKDRVYSLQSCTLYMDESPPQAKQVNICPFTFLYVTFSALLEEEMGHSNIFLTVFTVWDLSNNKLGGVQSSLRWWSIKDILVLWFGELCHLVPAGSWNTRATQPNIGAKPIYNWRAQKLLGLYPGRNSNYRNTTEKTMTQL